jgi:hypothetical protein
VSETPEARLDRVLLTAPTFLLASDFLDPAFIAEYPEYEDLREVAAARMREQREARLTELLNGLFLEASDFLDPAFIARNPEYEELQEVAAARVRQEQQRHLTSPAPPRERPLALIGATGTRGTSREARPRRTRTRSATSRDGPSRSDDDPLPRPDRVGRSGRFGAVPRRTRR